MLITNSLTGFNCNSSGTWPVLWFVSLFSISGSAALVPECFSIRVSSMAVRSVPSFRWLFSKLELRERLQFFAGLQLFELSNSAIASHVFLSSFASPGCGDGSKTHLVLDETVWFCTKWEHFCKLRGMDRSKVHPFHQFWKGKSHSASLENVPQHILFVSSLVAGFECSCQLLGMHTWLDGLQKPVTVYLLQLYKPSLFFSPEFEWGLHFYPLPFLSYHLRWLITERLIKLLSAFTFTYESRSQNIFCVLSDGFETC